MYRRRRLGHKRKNFYDSLLFLGFIRAEVSYLRVLGRRGGRRLRRCKLPRGCKDHSREHQKSLFFSSLPSQQKASPPKTHVTFFNLLLQMSHLIFSCWCFCAHILVLLFKLRLDSKLCTVKIPRHDLVSHADWMYRGV